jgi:hypothetical protein
MSPTARSMRRIIPTCCFSASAQSSGNSGSVYASMTPMPFAVDA